MPPSSYDIERRGAGDSNPRPSILNSDYLFYLSRCLVVRSLVPFSPRGQPQLLIKPVIIVFMFLVTTNIVANAENVQTPTTDIVKSIVKVTFKLRFFRPIIETILFNEQFKYDSTLHPFQGFALSIHSRHQLMAYASPKVLEVTLYL